MEKNSRHFWIRPARLQDRSSKIRRVPFETSTSFHFLGSDGRDIPASAAAQQQKPQYFPPPFPGMADMDENLGDVVRWCRHIQLLEQMKHDFESLYFLILQISNDGCPSNIQQQLLGYSRDEYLSLYSWVGSDHSFNHFLELPCMVTQHCGPHFWTCHLLNEWQDLDAPNIQCLRSC